MLDNTEWREKTRPSLLLLLLLVAFVMAACADDNAWRNDPPMSLHEISNTPTITQPLAPTLMAAPATPTLTTTPGIYHNPNLGLIIPGAEAQQTAATMLFETPGVGLALLSADERQMEMIQKTPVYDQPGGQVQPGEAYPTSKRAAR